jgi:hypothetical protein
MVVSLNMVFLNSDPIVLFVLPAQLITNGTTFNLERPLSAKQLDRATDRSWPPLPTHSGRL